MTLYLDIDGVLNDHQQLANGFCGTHPACVARMNRVLLAEPDLRLVIHSAWRYLILSGQMTLKGFESMLITHGLDCFGRVIGHTDPDERFLPPVPLAADYADISHRAHAIQAHARENSITRYVVVDDLPVPLPHLVRTDGARGLQDPEVEIILARLAAHRAPSRWTSAAHSTNTSTTWAGAWASPPRPGEARNAKRPGGGVMPPPGLLLAAGYRLLTAAYCSSP